LPLERFPPKVQFFWTDIDHFNFVSKSPAQKFAVKVLTYDGFYNRLPESPLLVYLGNEGVIESFYNNTGAMFEIAEEMGALVVFIEHRYYGNGTSLPWGGNSFTEEHLAFLTVEQAMGDFAEVLSQMRTDLECTGAKACPTILFGGSYGAMLVVWFRQKYPHLSVGGVAASAPVNTFADDLDLGALFWNASLSVFGSEGKIVGWPQCEQTVKKGMDEIQKKSLRQLSGTFPVCKKMETETDRLRLEAYVRGALSTLAMSDYSVQADLMQPLPPFPVREACKRMRQHVRKGKGSSPLLKDLVGAVNLMVNSTEKLECWDLGRELIEEEGGRERGNAGEDFSGNFPPSLSMGGNSLGDIWKVWSFQVCTELPMQPLTSEDFGFLIPFSEDHSRALKAACARLFPHTKWRPLWMRTATGGDSLGSVSNLIFSDGAKDPWGAGGPNRACYERIVQGKSTEGCEEMKPQTGSPQSFALHPSAVRLFIRDGAHHADLRASDPNDSEELRRARRKEREVMRKWIDEALGKEVLNVA